MEKYFRECKTIAEIKKVYRSLSFKFHPDHGGNEELFKELQNTYEKIISTFVDEIYSNLDENKKDFMNTYVYKNILRKIIHFDMDIEIIGHWIYAFNSFEYKDILKSLNFFFSRKHKAWIYNGEKKKVTYRSKYTTKDIRKKHGSFKVETEKNYLTS